MLIFDGVDVGGKVWSLGVTSDGIWLLTLTCGHVSLRGRERAETAGMQAKEENT